MMTGNLLPGNIMSMCHAALDFVRKSSNYITILSLPDIQVVTRLRNSLRATTGGLESKLMLRIMSKDAKLVNVPK